MRFKLKRRRADARATIQLLILAGLALLAPATLVNADDARTNVLLIGKERDHPPGSHEYLFECQLLAKCLRQTEGVAAVVSDGWPRDASMLDGVDVIVLYTAMGGNVLSDPAVRKQVEPLLARGVGLVMIHWSTGADDGDAGAWQLEHLGGWFGFSFSIFPVLDSAVHQIDKTHPIARGWSDFPMHDEYYTGLKFHDGARPLLTAEVGGKPEPIAWTFERPHSNGGRSFGTVCGHFHECFGIESFRRMLVNAVLWCARREVPEGGAACRLTEADLVLPPDPRVEPARVDDRAWADTNLPVSEGLAVWLDAQAQPRAYAAHGLAVPTARGPIGTVFDGSGNGRHVVQRHAPAQPTFFLRDSLAAVQFDGQDDALEQTAIGLKAEAATIFVVAAPRSNPGGFRGLVSLNRIGRRDYETGLTMDLGPAPSRNFETLNVEGQGFGGAPDLMNDSHPFGEAHVVEAVIGSGPKGVGVWVDGQAQTPRDRAAGPIDVQELTLGARFYTNEPRPGYLQGFLDGAIAEVLIYDRALSDTERARIRDYLRQKHAGLSDALDLVAPQAPPPPPVQMLVPGFDAYRLPLKLKNINNLRYRDDGVLVALGYNGVIYHLRDRDGDGLEDEAQVFWDGGKSLRAPIGMALASPGDARGRGVYVTCKGKCVFVADRDGDDHADEEIVLAQGWDELPHGVDALGVAVDGDGAVYFGLGAANFTNAYLVDAAGQAQYDLASERGTIQRIEPDGKRRAIVATGIRFPVALGFNAAGDLFCTDQEGATWLPNGNPFDELLWIRDRRHNGFPPRHSRHLPGVIDEPSVFDYSPQHQSTCGFVFNEPVGGGPVFGPAWWRGNALVCAYSRGKVFRTELVKSADAYFARNEVIAVLDTMPADCCVSPDGALVIAAHSGMPDWGSGPEGEGVLYKLRYTRPELPQPVAAWSRSETEFAVAFDRDAAALGENALQRGVLVTAAESARAGDRFESIRPGYAVVAAQQLESRQRWITHTRGPALADDLLVLGLNGATADLGYEMTIPLESNESDPRPGAIAQVGEMELGLSMQGTQAHWVSADKRIEQTSWIPHPELEVARAMMRHAPGLRSFAQNWEQPGRLVINSQLRLHPFLRPAVQRGARVDDVLPVEVPEIVIEASHPFAFGAATEGEPRAQTHASRDETGAYLLRWRPTEPGRVARFVIDLETGPGAWLRMRFRTNEDARVRPLTLERFVVPWARVREASEEGAARLPDRLARADAQRGRALFFGDRARCGQCHTIRGEGGAIGPDLSNLAQRDLDSVLRDIEQPSAALNPDHLTYQVGLADGRVLTGTLRTFRTHVQVGGGDGKVETVPNDAIDEARPLPVSTMPEGLLQELSAGEVDDLLRFLLAPDAKSAGGP